jgi:hypothetical protein
LGIGFETLDRRFFDPEKTYEPLEKLGIKWARVQTGWSRCETTKGKYDFAWLDEIVDTLRGHGIQPWFNLTYGNQLYSPQAINAFAVGWAPITDETRQPWLRFVRALAEHFRGRVQHWEIWNEPNITLFWKPKKPSPAGYAELVKLTAPAIRASIPDAVLIGGGFSGAPVSFLEGCLDAGMADHVDRISFHPYRLVPESNYVQDVEKMRALLAHHKPSLALWQGECGCPSAANSGGALSKHHWNEPQQARWLLRRVLNDLRLKVEHVSWYNVADQLDYASGWRKQRPQSEKPEVTTVDYGTGAQTSARNNLYFGLLRVPGYTPKPSYFAYQNLCALFDSQTKTADVPMQFAGDFPESELDVSVEKIEQAAFARVGCPLVAYWFPVAVQKNMPTQAVDVTIAVKSDLMLRKPVLVNPLNGNVSKLEGEQSAGQWKFTALPLTDYPMLITDAAVVLLG